MESSAVPNSPGKLRTWWHPLLVRMLEWLLRDSCEVQDEVMVGRMPLRLDILLIRRLDIRLPEAALRDLSAICRRLNNYTLIEFKSPTDSLGRGDWNKLLGCAHLFVAQSESGIRSADMTLMILAPRLTQGFLEELRQCNARIVEEETGIHRIEESSFLVFLVETDRVAGTGEPALTVFSHEFVDHPGHFVESLKLEHAEMLYYVMQQIEQFRKQMPEFEVQHMTENMNQTFEELEASVLNAIPVDKVLKRIPSEEVMKRYSAEERLRGVSPEERLRGVSPEERLRGLGEEELNRMRKLLFDPTRTG